MTDGLGRDDCTGVVWFGIAGMGGAGAPPADAAAKPAALTADNAPVMATTPETPPAVHHPTRRSAWSRSSGWYRPTSAVASAATAPAIVVVAWLRCWGRAWGRLRGGRCCWGGRRRSRCHTRRRRRRISDHDRLVNRRRRSGSRIQAVGREQRRRECRRNRVLTRGAEVRKGSDMTRGRKTGDDA